MATPLTSPPSSTNPFTSPHLTPQNTNQSASSMSTSVTTPQPQRQDTEASVNNAIPDEAPPAYTPSANSRQGEATVDYGPRRPFQQPSAPDYVVNQPPPGSIIAIRPALGQHMGGSTLRAPAPPRSTVFSPRPAFDSPTPPLHPSTASVPPPTRTFSPPPGPPPQRATTPPQQFLPPPGSPPRRAVSSASAPSRGNASSAVPGDGRPTTTPVPGHPLLRDGRMLVYPVGHFCNKCGNTGYKNFDPSNPCRKCWDRYAKSYVGALFYAPAAPSSTSNSGGNFQRPLPTFRPPHVPAPPPQNGGYPGTMHHTQTQSQPNFAPQHPPPPTTIFTNPYAPPPQGATVVRPGDPRIGGRLCWRCGGRGSVTFMIFDQETCEVCNGMGRVFS